MKKIKTISLATLTMGVFFSILSYAFTEKFESSAQIYIKDKFSDTSIDANITSFLGNQDLGIFDQKDISNKIFLDQILSKSLFKIVMPRRGIRFKSSNSPEGNKIPNRSTPGEE